MFFAKKCYTIHTFTIDKDVSVLELFKSIVSFLGDYALSHILPSVTVFVIGTLIVRIIVKFLQKGLARTKLDPSAISLILSVVRIALLLLVCLIAVSFLGIDVSGIVALASVLTLAISLSVQDALTNLIGGFTLINTKPFSIDDYVEIGGQSGTVQKIGLTYTQLVTPDGKTVSMPNSTVVSAQIINYTVNGIRRVDIPIRVAYSNDPESVIKALLCAAQVPTALSTPAPYCAVTEYGDSTIGYILQVWTVSNSYIPTLHAVNRSIRDIFQERNIAMTYPHLNVHIQNSPN